MTGYRVLSTLVLLLSGWLAGAESASWALLQPVVARLEDTPQIRMQQGIAEHPPQGWQADRRRWHTYQGVRAVLLAVWFLCAVTAVTIA